MPVVKSQSLPISCEREIVEVRQMVRRWATELGFGLVDQTKIITAASELARNTLVHGGGGAMLLEWLEEGVRKGLRVTFTDSGPGIADISLAMRDGYTTAAGLGLGLGGAKRLSNEFEISSTVGKGTRISVTRWK